VTTTERAWIAERVASTTILPLGDRAEHLHRWRPVHRSRAWTDWMTAAGVLGGLAAAALGLRLATTAPSTAVSLGPDGYHIGSATLHPAGDGRYIGAGALVLRSAQGLIVASAAGMVAGHQVDGVCLVDSGRSEHCLFRVSGSSLTAVDTFADGGWTRRYDDGQRVQISATAPVPVPFPVGR
jgi:hypothetical protein